MSAPLQELATVASAVAAISINALWQDALLVGCVWMLLRAWPTLNASTRYTVWSVTLAAAVVVPVATTLPFFTAPVSAPAYALVAQSAFRPSATKTIRVYSVISRERASVLPPTVASTPVLPPRLHLTLPLQLSVGVFAAWLLVTLYALARITIGLIRLERLKRDALPLPIEYRETMARWINVNKGSRDVRLCVSDAIDVPVAVGLFDSMILIPRSLLVQLSEAEIDQISLHELAHLRRRDDWSNGLQRVAIALLSWNPAALFVGQQLDFEREVACDDWVLSLVGAVRPYAMCLTKMAETAAWPRQPMAAPGVFATRRHISMRIERLLAAGRNIATTLALGPAAVAVAAVTGVALVIAVVAPSVAAPSIPPVPVVAQTVAVPAAPASSAPLSAAHSIVPKPAQPPTVHANLAGAEVRVPPQQVHVQSRVEHIPAIAVPARTVKVPATVVTIPEMRFSVPSIDANGLEASITKSIAQSTGAAFGPSHGSQSGHACSACDFSGVNWPGRDLHGVAYTGVDLSKANLAGTNFTGGTFTGVDFSEANLRGASFRDARLTGCDFSRANLTNADFTGARVSGCQFTRATLSSSAIRDVLNSCSGCDFSEANMNGLDLSNVRATLDDFSKVDLRNANLAGAQLTSIDFSHARLDGANLAGATLTQCNLSGVDLRHVDLSKTHLVGTNIDSDLSRP